MAVDVDLHVLAVGLLDTADDVVRRLRLQQCSHVLQRDRLGAHVEQLTGELHVALGGVQRGDRVADGALRVLAGLLDGLHRVRHVARVVQCVEDAEDVHAVLRRLVDETLHHFILVVAVAQQVLAPQQHLQPGVGHQLAERPQTLPGVLVEEPDACIVGSTAPALDAPVAGLVDVLAGFDHVFHGHADRYQTLVSVAKDELGNTNGSLTHEHILPDQLLHAVVSGRFGTGVRRAVSCVQKGAALSRSARSSAGRTIAPLRQSRASPYDGQLAPTFASRSKVYEVGQSRAPWKRPALRSQHWG